jgi:hypothetical protein
MIQATRDLTRIIASSRVPPSLVDDAAQEAEIAVWKSGATARALRARIIDTSVIDFWRVETHRGKSRVLMPLDQSAGSVNRTQYRQWRSHRGHIRQEYEAERVIQAATAIAPSVLEYYRSGNKTRNQHRMQWHWLKKIRKVLGITRSAA